MTALLFIDTNILLDFYRVRGSDVSLSLLNRINNNHGKIITTSQVETEYKKNRQRAIASAIKDIKISDDTIQLPAFLKESQITKSIDDTRGKLKKHIKTELGNEP